MEKVLAKLKTVKMALAALKDAIDTYESLSEERYRKHIRASKIQNFEICVDVLWKFLHVYFTRVSGAQLPTSPKPVLQHCLKEHLLTLDQTERLLDMVDDRNLTSHVYLENLAERINGNAEDYYNQMCNLVNKLAAKIEA